MRDLPQCSCPGDSQRPGGQWGGQHEPKGLQGEGGRDVRNLPSLPPLAVARPGHPNTNIPGSLTKPSCLAAATGRKPAPRQAALVPPGAGGACLSLLAPLPQHSPGFPSCPPHPTYRGSGLAPLTCLRFLRSLLFSRVHCFLLCMSQPCGNKTHSWLVTKAIQIKQM